MTKRKVLELAPTEQPHQLYKSLRQARYEKLLHEGFLGFEARAISIIKFKVPYMKELRRERRNYYKSARAEHTTKNLYVNDILNSYSENEWTKTNKNGFIIADPFRMVKAFEREYKNRHPEYRSPTKKELQEARELESLIAKASQREENSTLVEKKL